jgi:hypothetical protein
MMEDDVLIRGKIEIPEDTEFSGFALPGNKFQPEFLNYLKTISTPILVPRKLINIKFPISNNGKIDKFKLRNMVL